ncbi:heterokaryon incompatibility protein-domain-containing protein, partial [Rhexocercosporidium sp. MPI-PUGE-AT-0058]
RNTLRQAELWIRKCLKHHKECRDHGHGIGLPTRVIDVGPSDGSKDPRLYIPAKSTAGPSAEFRYVSLSYCWGEKQNFVTTLENLESLKAGIPWDSLPQTMKGAISITRGLGIRYLWIDALCIVQDSLEDWTNESVKMADVYGGAFLTLSAAHGASVHDGLPRLPGTEKHRFPLQKDPLYSRAWALQERILSTRILIFGSDQMYWECHCSREGEDGKTLPKTISYRLPLKPTLQDWNFVVMDYSSRCLTNETDKLPALSGLADVFHRATNYTYIAGLWRETLLKDLLWKQQWMLYGNQVEPGLPSQYRAPSWSWASIDG